MLTAARKMIEIPRIADRLQIFASGRFGVGSRPKKAYTLEAGAPLTAEQIMERFGVDRAYAEAFLRRNS